MLLERGKLETARIKTENSTHSFTAFILDMSVSHCPQVINEDIYVELLELLELYCELLISRFSLLDQKSVMSSSLASGTTLIHRGVTVSVSLILA